MPEAKPKSVKILALVATVTGIIIAIGGIWLISHTKNSSTSPLPSKIVKQANFQLYYPSSLPSGYALDQSSVRFENDIVFFSVSNDGRNTLYVSEQAVSATPPDFKALQQMNTSFKPVDTPAGEAIVGVSAEVPVGLLLTNVTLVNVNGVKNGPRDTVDHITRNLRSLSQ